MPEMHVADQEELSRQRGPASHQLSTMNRGNSESSRITLIFVKFMRNPASECEGGRSTT
jgi:hypothetical protein